MTISPTYSDITYFLDVALTGNISRASERLGITQPSLSAAIKRLEESLGSTLFIRSRTGVQLTKAGLELQKKGRMLLLSWEQLKSDINKSESAITGEYIIGCHVSVALFSLSSFLPDLIQKHPDLNIKLTHDLSRKISERVISFEIDFGIVINPVRHPDLVIKELATDDVQFWTAAKPSSTQNLDPATGVLICDTNLIQSQKLLDELQKRNFGFKRMIQCNSLEVITDLTASGVGVGMLPTRVAKRIASQKLTPLSDRLPKFKDKICLIYRADAQKTKAGHTIIEAIKKSVK
jgi:LysR family transcriptional regulator, cell division regulator